MSLKAQLLGERVPRYRIVLPEGWVRHEPSAEVGDDLLKAAKSRLMQAHRPDLYGSLQAATKGAFESMRRAEVIAFYMPGPETPEELYLPLSVTASIRRRGDGAALDADVTRLIREHGATALGDDQRFLTWRRDSVQRLAGGSVPVTTVFYLTPVPDSGRTRGLLFSLVIPRPTDTDALDITDAATALFDNCISSLVWEPS